MTNGHAPAWATVFLVGASVAFAATSATPTVSFSPQIPSTDARQSASRPLVALEAVDRSLADVLQDLAKQAKTTILVEPGVEKRTTAHLQNVPLTAALDTLTRDSGSTWARVQIVQKKGVPLPAEALYNLVRAAGELGTRSVSMWPSGGSQALILTPGVRIGSPVSGGETERLEVYVVASQTSATPAFSVGTAIPSSASVPGTTESENVNRVRDLSQQRFNLLQQMSPVERQQALQQDLLYMLQLPPQMQLQLRLDQRAALQSLPPDLQQQYRQAMRGLGQQMGGGRGRPWGGGLP